MLEITDLSLLKITKIKDWAVYFTYNSEKYLLHESSEYSENATTLYKRIPLNDFGKYNLKYVCSCYGSAIPYIKYKTERRLKNYKSRPYNTINLNKFVWDMTWKGFYDGIYLNEVKERKQRIKEIDDVIKTLDSAKNKLREH